MLVQYLFTLAFMNDNPVIDEINKSAYAAAEVVDWYEDLDFILKPEAAILRKITPVIKDKKLLDIGIGAGRTTKFLLEISKDYTGIDYTPRSAELAQEKFPAAKILCCDARDLRVFGDAVFDFVLFSFNAIDYMIHEDRVRVLREIHRVLKPGGLFMFSTHNRDHKYFDKFPWQEGKFDLGHLKSCLYTFLHLPKHYRMKKHEIRTERYAIINDTAHGFSLLAYYISLAEQVKQLDEAGFVEVEAYDMEGNPTEQDRDFPWIYYLARRRP
jgi:ubiquinone/menaquinone biosynthesis C-methylase UbiE